ncbi:hypothetical protein [Leadbetterella sp. DM7]|uniref:hypothetical protein n=1 Tax=Leadbetterella sp. DM7 TaxID=3235085 RepID=UPI00349EABD7
MKIFRITKKSNTGFLKNFLFYLLLTLIGTPALMYFKRGSIDIESFLWISLPFFTIFFLIPTLVIHLNYYYLNRGMKVYYEESKKQLRVAGKLSDITFYVSDIQSVTEVKTPPKAENRNMIFPWDEYHYSLVELKNGEKFYFTSLILPNLNLPIDKSKITLKKRFYPAIW